MKATAHSKQNNQAAGGAGTEPIERVSARVRGVRRQIAAGTYDTPERVELAADRLIGELADSDMPDAA